VHETRGRRQAKELAGVRLCTRRWSSSSSNGDAFAAAATSTSSSTATTTAATI
jgi:hypothetical protein